MNYFVIEPEVAGEIGDGSVLDTTVHPPLVSKLNYQFFGWLGDSILESFPCFIVIQDLASNLMSEFLSGVSFHDVEISISDEFRGLYPNRVIPDFCWMKVSGVACKDDFGIALDYRLVISERALKVLQKFCIENALVEEINS
ncbi:hypothetical protein [Xanthomonas phaseoli]|uniref:hypothetical protein n=1 Tax=Xanthomonas phaseoli TaxID=1985254 RepID=UPI0009B99D00|nr:hypothetical protein [Xanthomonas phaseoli]